jgi:predicted RNA-binding protein with PIN domain
MPLLIDGHNLIPKIPGLSLDALDDEQQLIEMLQEYCRLQRKQAEVFFDQASPGGARAHNFGLVTARFVRQGSTADQAIRQRLYRLGRSARNWTVVSSDQAIQAETRAAQARLLSSEEFAAMLVRVLRGDATKNEQPGNEEISPEELQDWLGLFGVQEDG